MICRCVTESRLPGWIAVRQGDGYADYVMCPDCGGGLIASCCDTAGSADKIYRLLTVLSIARDSPQAPPLVAQIRDALSRPPAPPDPDGIEDREEEEF